MTGCLYITDANDCICHDLQHKEGVASHYITCPVVARAERSGGCSCVNCTGWIGANEVQGALRTN